MAILLFLLASLSVASCALFEEPANATVTFQLRVRDTHLTNQTIDPQNLTNFKYVKGKPFKVLVHAYKDTPEIYYIPDMTREYLKKDNFNVVVVNWTVLAGQQLRITVQNTLYVGFKIGDLIIALNRTLNVPMEDFHLIAPSIGSQVAAYAAKHVQNETGFSVGRLTGLDPAGLIYDRVPPYLRFGKNDALFVDAMHTDWGFIGINYIGGDADFFPNGGYGIQPGCRSLDMILKMFITICSHKIIVHHFIESINSYDFVAHQCDRHEILPSIYLSNYTSYVLGYCQNYPTALMGENCALTAKGDYYLRTNPSPPYARGNQI